MDEEVQRELQECVKDILIFVMDQIEQEVEIERMRPQKVWQRKWIARRSSRGASYQLLKELAEEDPSEYYYALRMTENSFNDLLQKVGPVIQKRDTFMRCALPAKDKLHAVLYMIANGNSLRSIQHLFRIPKSTLSEMIPEVCDAIYNALKDKIKQRDTEQIAETTQSDFEHGASEYVQQSERSQENQEKIMKPPRKRAIRDLDRLVTRVKNVSDTINSSIHGSNTEFDYFGKNVASQLNNMPLALAIEAQTHIQNYLSELRLQHINSSQNYFQPSSSSHSYYFSSTPSPTSYVAASPEQITEPNSCVVAPASPEQLAEPNSYVVVQASSEQMTEPNSYVIVQASSEQMTDVDPTNEDNILAQACEAIRYC